jgi:hypothetical protein
MPSILLTLHLPWATMRATRPQILILRPHPAPHRRLPSATSSTTSQTSPVAACTHMKNYLSQQILSNCSSNFVYHASLRSAHPQLTTPRPTHQATSAISTSALLRPPATVFRSLSPAILPAPPISTTPAFARSSQTLSRVKYTCTSSSVYLRSTSPAFHASSPKQKSPNPTYSA